MSSTFQHGAARRVIASLVVAAALAAAPSAHATVFGGVSITGTRWVNGVPTKVRCGSADGNTLDATAYGVRIFTLQNTPSCPIWEDTGLGDFLKFDGRERHIIKGGVAIPQLSFSGVQTWLGPNFVDPAAGTASGILKCGPASCNSEKGNITYSRTTPSQDRIIFIGTYKASF